MRNTITNIARPETQSLKCTMARHTTIAAILALLIAGISTAWADAPKKTSETVKAGVDRTVILGGKTYLSGELPMPAGW